MVCCGFHCSVPGKNRKNIFVVRVESYGEVVAGRECLRRPVPDGDLKDIICLAGNRLVLLNQNLLERRKHNVIDCDRRVGDAEPEEGIGERLLPPLSASGTPNRRVWAGNSAACARQWTGAQQLLLFKLLESRTEFRDRASAHQSKPPSDSRTTQTSHLE